MAVSNNSGWWDEQAAAVPGRAFTFSSVRSGTSRVYPSPPDGITEQVLQSDVFNVAVDALVDIWLLRFGNSWVNLDDIERDEFFRLAFTRLKSLGKLEMHYLTDRAKYVCRKPE